MKSVGGKGEGVGDGLGPSPTKCSADGAIAMICGMIALRRRGLLFCAFETSGKRNTKAPPLEAPIAASGEVWRACCERNAPSAPTTRPLSLGKFQQRWSERSADERAIGSKLAW